ncbi:UDP-glycosyltransferase UGT5-like [Anopheles darlingi]|uniref:UDP-glycosyltransferase UGT5-like n=1 Tax=Anopheles darlingi TaxID=43151 RepID=UPI0021001141|nr:UDP-glycosyltransferase UGT5-like [Anopheles darlingi]
MSHWLMFEHVINELLQRGHTVTAITSYRLRSDASDESREPQRYREVLIEPIYDFEANGLPMDEFFKSPSFSNPFFKMATLWKLGLETSEHAFECANVREFLRTEGLRFDLLIAEEFVQESFLLLAYKYRVPIVTINTLGQTDFLDQSFGLLTPWSQVPHFMLEFENDMTLPQRAYNVFLSLWDLYNRKYYYLPAQTALARKHFGHLEATHGILPALEDLERNISIALLNTHIVTTKPRPRVDRMVQIAGLHIRPPKPLPSAIQTFLDSANNGFIYINFGTFLRSSNMPPATLDVFLSVFRGLSNYRFLWKWEADSGIPNLPSNVMLQRWLPQNDVLAHRNLKLFVSHGGLFGTQEAIYWARPVLFMPFYGDQHQNAHKFEKAGLGLTLSIINVTVDRLQTTMERILGGPSFQQQANRLSAIFRDNPIEPLGAAVYWIEYVVRHHGAPHMKSGVEEQPWWVYTMVDLGLLTVLFVFIVLWVVTVVVKAVVGLVGLRQQRKIKVN